MRSPFVEDAEVLDGHEAINFESTIDNFGLSHEMDYLFAEEDVNHFAIDNEHFTDFEDGHQHLFENEWKYIVGAKSIAAAKNGDLWRITTVQEGNDFKIEYRSQNATTWTSMDGAGIKIAVDINGFPWVINSKKELYKRDANGWHKINIQSLVHSIAFSESASWFLLHLQSKLGLFEYKNGIAIPHGVYPIKLCVSAQNTPWIINSAGDVQYLNNNVWTTVFGIKAIDIAIDGTNKVWVLGTDKNGNDHWVYNLDSIQSGKWTKSDGAGISITNGLDGNIYVINSRGECYRYQQSNGTITSIYNQIGLSQHGLDEKIFTAAYNGYKKLEAEGKLSNKNVLSIIDFTQSSKNRRFYIIDLANMTLKLKINVAHGRGKGSRENSREFLKYFSNVKGSNESSLGFYVTGSKYNSTRADHNYRLSLRIKGMETEFNSNAYDRAIVIHPADYVYHDNVSGRSEGCPAIHNVYIKEVVEFIKDGTCLFLYFNDPHYLTTSSYVNYNANLSPSSSTTQTSSNSPKAVVNSSGLNYGTLILDTSATNIGASFSQYQFTQEDALWLARFVVGEAGGYDNADSHAVIWAMFNRFALLRHKVPTWTSFSVFIRKYSTTLQPLLNSLGAAERVWRNHRANPSKYPIVTGTDYYENTTVLKVQYKKHIDLQNKKWSDFNSSIQLMVTNILNGKISNPGIGNATDFENTYVYLLDYRRKNNISGEPSYQDWVQYTLKNAENKGKIWIGEKANLNQKSKNAFFILKSLSNFKSNLVSVVGFPMTSNESHFPENFESNPYNNELDEFAYINEVASENYTQDDGLTYDHYSMDFHEAFDEAEFDTTEYENRYDSTEALQHFDYESDASQNYASEHGSQVSENYNTEEYEHHDDHESEHYFTSEDNFLSDNETSLLNIPKAITANRKLANSVGWSSMRYSINNFLLPIAGLQNVSMDEPTFARALSRWQSNVGLTSDGILGPSSWSVLKPLIASSPITQPTAPVTTTKGPVGSNVFVDNKFYAQSILNAINGGFVTVNANVTYHPKSQLEAIVQGIKVLNIDPRVTTIQILPVLHHICQEAMKNNYRDIVIGSFIRGASNGKCTGHCIGRCIDINYKGGSFSNMGATQMVANVLNYLRTIPPYYGKNFGFGLPFQGSFLRNVGQPKFSSTSTDYIIDNQVRTAITGLGILFPDNDNHLHIQVKWK